jgi:hypothetical protein
MKKTVWTYGLLSGGILAALTATLLPLCFNGTLEFENSELVGYSAMLLSFIAVFFGIRSYREKQGGGAITFGKAFQVGILITLVTCAVYVIGWEIVYWGFIPDFGDKFAALTLEKARADGMPPAEIASLRESMDRFKVWYRNPFFNVGMTFLEVFPVGLVMTVISAAMLRRKGNGSAAAESALA